MVAALKKAKGMVYHAAAKLGCEPDTITNRSKVSPKVAACIGNQRGKFKDAIESKFIQAVNKGQAWAIRLGLVTLCKDRGYIEREDVRAEFAALLAELAKLRAEYAELQRANQASDAGGGRAAGGDALPAGGDPQAQGGTG